MSNLNTIYTSIRKEVYVYCMANVQLLLDLKKTLRTCMCFEFSTSTKQ